MKTQVRNSWIKLIDNEEIKKDVKEFIRPVFTMIYNEIYVYIWIICIYHIFFIFVILAILLLLLRYISKQSKIISSSVPLFSEIIP